MSALWGLAEAQPSARHWLVAALLVLGVPFSCGYCARPYIERVHVDVSVSQVKP